MMDFILGAMADSCLRDRLPKVSVPLEIEGTSCLAPGDMSRDVSMGEGKPCSSFKSSPGANLSYLPRSSTGQGRNTKSSSFNGAAQRDGMSSVSRRFSAPSGFTDSESDSTDDMPQPSFSIQAPTGYSDTDQSDEEEVTSAPSQPAVLHFVPPTAAEQALHELQRHLQRKWLITAQKGAAAFHSKWLEIEAQERRDYATVTALMDESRVKIAKAEAARQAVLWEGQQRVMIGLQQEHMTAAEAMDRNAQAALRQAEEERQALLEAQRRQQEEAAAEQRVIQEAAELASRQAEKQREQEEREREQREAEAAQRQGSQREAGSGASSERQAQEQADVKRRQQSAAESVSTSGTIPGLRIAPRAADYERACREALRQAQASAKQLDGGLKKEKRAIFKRINALMAQTGGTQEQVNVKSSAIVEMLRGLHGAPKAYAMQQLATAFLDLSEKVDSRFPVAEVAVAVCNAQPELVPVILGMLHEVCPLAIPKCFVRLKAESADEFNQRWGFQKVELLDKVTKQPKQDWEDVDVFLVRVEAHIEFYAAFVQSDQQRVHGIENAWRYLSWLLGVLPPNRYTAFALQAFMTVAGFKMHQVYRSQFAKLLIAADQFFINEIVQKGMEDARSSVRRLRQYLQGQEFLKEPPGRKLEMYDASSYDRA